MSNCVEVHNVSKSFGTVKAVDSVSFSVAEGEMLGLIGPDGAGKSTLFRLMTTLYVPDEGSVSVKGFDTVRDYKSIRNIVGYMPGRFSLYQDLSVEENLNFYASVFGTTIEENYNLISDIYCMLEPFKKRLAGKLSGGMKQKLALSCALIHAPKVLFLDEPTTGVDPVSRFEFWEMLHKLKQRGITIIVSTPYMDEATKCDRMALMKDGRLFKVCEPAVVATEFGETLWKVQGENIYKLLTIVRENPIVSSCFSFGDSLHITLQSGADIETLKKYLVDNGCGIVNAETIVPTVEDYYMKLVTE